MARTIAEIQDVMLTAKANEPLLNGLTNSSQTMTFFQKVWNYFFGEERSTSKVAIWQLWVYIVAFVIYTLEVLFDIHRTDVSEKLSKLKPHTARWYRNKALAFQYGFDLLEDSDNFNNENATDEQIETSRIIKYSAVTEAEDESRLIVKIATENDEILSPVDATQYDAFKNYIAEIKDAGVKVTIINYLPDRLKLNIRIVRDALVLDSNGMNRNTAEFPVNDAIQQFMKELPFNGELSIQKLEEKLLAVNGVQDLSIDLAETSWIDGESSAYGDWQPIDISKIPNAGYFTVNLTEDNDTKSTINYV